MIIPDVFDGVIVDVGGDVSGIDGAVIGAGGISMAGSGVVTIVAGGDSCGVDSVVVVVELGDVVSIVDTGTVIADDAVDVGIVTVAVSDIGADGAGVGVGADIEAAICGNIAVPGVPSWMLLRPVEVVGFCQSNVVKLRSMDAKVVEEPKSGVPGSVRESTMMPLVLMSVMVSAEFGMLTAVVTMFGLVVSVVFASPSA